MSSEKYDRSVCRRDSESTVRWVYDQTQGSNGRDPTGTLRMYRAVATAVMNGVDPADITQAANTLESEAEATNKGAKK